MPSEALLPNGSEQTDVRVGTLIDGIFSGRTDPRCISPDGTIILIKHSTMYTLTRKLDELVADTGNRDFWTAHITQEGQVSSVLWPHAVMVSGPPEHIPAPEYRDLDPVSRQEFDDQILMALQEIDR